MLKRLLQRRSPSAATAALRPEDIGFLTPVRSAQVVEPAPAAMWAVYLLLALLATAIAWAAVAQVDIVVRANARVVPDGREQVIASLEGGILRELKVREGQQVAEGEELALIDPTRFEAQQAEGQAKRLSLLGMVARLEAESVGRELRFPADLAAKSPQVAQGETDSWRARQRALDEAVGITRRNAELLQRELSMAQTLSARGLMSEVEVMRLRRQVNDLQLQVQERVNRFRQDASAELVRARTELSQLEEQLVVRDDALRRTVLTSPVRGVVKQIRVSTIGGVIGPGAPVMEIVPIGSRVLVEARIRPADIGFVQVGQEVVVKLSAYEYSVYGGLKGQVQSISPDVLRDAEKAMPGTEAGYFKAMIRADRSSLRAGDKPLQVLPGMSGTADVRTGERSVLSYLLRPLMKSQEAFRER
jgi:adhesin transport system membrane fusion protein